MNNNTECGGEQKFLQKECGCVTSSYSVKTDSLSIDRKMDKEIVVQIYNEISF
jgi:hypothetical protein